MPDRQFIEDFAANQLIEGIFSLHNCQLGLTRSGKPYLKCLIGDKSGRLPGRMWNASQQLYQSLPADGFVRVQGQTQPYQGQIQIILRNIEKVEVEAADLRELIPCTQHDIEQMFEEVRSILATLQSPALRTLADCYLSDEQWAANFKQAPAATQLHHAFLGGLLEHTLSLLRLGRAVLPQYPRLSPDLVLMGLFLHDLGKCEELTWRTGFAYSEDGRLVGHVARGLLRLEQEAERCAQWGQPIPEQVHRVLQHIIVSHHGEPEFGALIRPSTPEAILVNMLDNLDAKVQMAEGAVRRDAFDPENTHGHFTDKHWALQTRLYRPDPLTDLAHCE